MLKVENLSFSVNEKGAELNILSDISFDVKKGEIDSRQSADGYREGRVGKGDPGRRRHH